MEVREAVCSCVSFSDGAISILATRLESARYVSSGTPSLSTKVFKTVTIGADCM